jgi:hypothetical protein
MPTTTVYMPTENDVAAMKRVVMRDRRRPTESGSYPREDIDFAQDIYIAKIPDDQDFIPARGGSTCGSLDCDIYRIDLSDGSLDAVTDVERKVYNIYMCRLYRMAQPYFKVVRTKQGAWLCEKPRMWHKVKVDGADITAGSSGNCKLVFNGAATALTITAHLNWMHGGEQISDGKEAMVHFSEDENKWWLSNAECEAPT